MDLELEISLIQKAQIDVNSFHKLYEEYFTQVYCYVFNRLADKDLTQAVVSESFLGAILEIKRISPDNKSRFSKFLYPIVNDLTSQAIAQIKSKQPVNNVDHNKAQLIYSLRNLAGSDQELLAMRYWAGQSDTALADFLRSDTLKLTAALNSAVSKLRKKFMEKYPESEIFAEGAAEDEVKTFFSAHASITPQEVQIETADFKNNLKGEIYDDFITNLKTEVNDTLFTKLKAQLLSRKALVLLFLLIPLPIIFTFYQIVTSDEGQPNQNTDTTTVVKARIEKFEGKVEVRENANAGWVAVRGVSDIPEGGGLRTVGSGRASIVLPNKNVVRIDGDSTLILDKMPSEGAYLLTLEDGAAYARVLADTQTLDLVSDDYTYSSNEAAFRVINYEGSKGTEVFYGDVEVSGGEDKSLTEGQYYFTENIADEANENKIVTLKASFFADDEFIIWNRSLDKRIAGLSDKMGILDDLSAPDLIIDDPDDGDIITTEKIMVKGETEDKAKVTVNGKKVTVTGGRFEVEITLKIGSNIIEVVAEDESGNKTTLQITVSREAEPTPTSAPTAVPTPTTNTPSATPAPTATVAPTATTAPTPTP